VEAGSQKGLAGFHLGDKARAALNRQATRAVSQHAVDRPQVDKHGAMDMPEGVRIELVDQRFKGCEKAVGASRKMRCAA